MCLCAGCVGVGVWVGVGGVGYFGRWGILDAVGEL